MEALAVLFVLALAGGWLLGVVGFFKALSARAEIAVLRRRLDALAAGRPILRASVPFVPAPPVVEPAEPELPPAAVEPNQVHAAPEPATAVERPDIEALLTARWGVWLGAAALVFAASSWSATPWIRACWVPRRAVCLPHCSEQR